MDYKNSKIYKIISNETEDIYIGSTTQPLYKRFYEHKSKYKLWLGGQHCYVSSFELLKYGKCDIILIEDHPCERKEQLHARERYWIENTNCINKNIPTRTKKEYDKQYHKQYRKDNKEKIKEKRCMRVCCLRCEKELTQCNLTRHLKTKACKSI
jgi:hypothetical protein